ncbi:MAG: RsmE family RNA methyltransferase [Candidatus Firestonebacteria bacterium]
MRRFFVAPKRVEGDTVEITGSDVRHIRDVLRMRVGDKITAVDGSSTEFTVVLTEFSGEQIRGKIERRDTPAKEPAVGITLAQSVPKADKMELIIKMCTELGVYEVVPVTSERVIVHGDFSRKIERWQRISEEAAKQSGRTIVPKIRPVEKLVTLLSRLEEWDKAIMPWEVHKEGTINKALQGVPPKKVLLFIGPEGGYSYEEAEAAKVKGALLVTLGSRILRVETAAPVAVTLIMNKLGEM